MEVGDFWKGGDELLQHVVRRTQAKADSVWREGATMRGTLGAFIQSCVILLVRADQWRLKDSANCELNKKVSRYEAKRSVAQVDLMGYIHFKVVSGHLKTATLSFIVCH